MIRVTVYDDVFDPTKRTHDRVEYRHGSRISDYVPASLEHLGTAAWLNGGFVGRDNPVVQDGDHIHLASPPGGGAELLLAMQYLFAAIAVSMVTAVITKKMLPKEQPVQDNLGGSTYSYYGFRNMYRPEGDAIPVVYGSMRVAPPCINQSVTGAVNWGGAGGNQAIQIGIHERLNSMYAVSHGPIQGFGSLEGDVYDQASFEAVVGPVNIAENISFQINGIPGQHISASFSWRTGLNEQEPIKGSLPAGGLPVTNPGTSYDLAFEIAVGTADISEADKPAGVYPYAGTDYISDGNATQYVSLLLAQKADVCDVQVLFPRGLFSGGNTGGYDTQSATIRIQYWKTDSTGTSTSDVVLLPEFVVTASVLSPISVDIPFTLFDPATYATPYSQGYARLDSENNARLYNNNSTGMVRCRPGNSNLDSNLKFTFACWASLRTEGGATFDNRDLWLLAWSNDRNNVSSPDNEAGGHGMLNAPSGWAEGDAFFGVKLHVDVNENFNSGTANSVYVIITAYEKRNGDWAASWWRSTTPIGSIGGTFGADWPEADPAIHICLAYDGTNWANNGSGSGEWRLTVDGNVRAVQLGAYGDFVSQFWGSQYNYNGTANDPGFLWKGTSTAAPAYTHVPPQFPVASGANNYFSIGSVLTRNDSGNYQTSEGAVSQFLLYDGLIGGDLDSTSAWGFIASHQTDANGNYTYDIRSMQNDPAHSGNIRSCFPMDDGDVVASNYYKNFAYPDAIATTDGALAINLTGSSVVTTGGPIWFGETGTPTEDYYYVEVFKESPSYNNNDQRDLATVDSITTWATEDYSYPGVAYLATSIRASDQINSNEPNITLICKGKRVNIWDGGSEDTPVFSEQWSNNPAWVALDMLADSQYGLGSIFNEDGTYSNLDLPKFFEWSQFCDEGVADAFGTLSFFSLETLVNNSTEPTDKPYRVKLRFGITDSSGVGQQSVPASWKPGASQSVASITAAGISGAWLTANDVVGGTNDVSNMMQVVTMEFIEATTAYHGWSSYLEIECAWNRTDSSGDPIWPEGATGTAYFADEYGIATLGTAGQYERRCTFDGVFDQKERPAWDALIDIMQCGRAMPAKVGSKIFPIWDRPRDPVGLFSMANIVEGSLEIDYLSSDTSPNSIETEILDADHGFERRTVLVDHSSIQNPSGFGQVRKERSKRLGITRRSQAIRDAYYRLNRYALQLRQFKFKVGPDALHMIPGDRVLLSHDVPQYGYSGRLAADATIANSHPGSGGLVAAWNQNGGNCTISIGSLLVADSTTPPISGYANAALGYALPTANSGTSWHPAGELVQNGYNGTIESTAQMVATGDGLYPFSGNENVPISPLDRIITTEDKKEFSVYVKEPTYGASEGVELTIYRYIDDEGSDVRVSYSVLFTWNGSGDLVATTTTGGGCVTNDITEISAGWWRATVFYDNAHASGGGSAARGDYIQARLFYATASGSSTWYPSPTGRNSQLWYFGDPLNLDGFLPGTTTKAWTQVNPTAGSPTENSISHSTAVAPPFYPNDTGSDAGKRGYVVRMTNNEAFGDKQPSITQDITLPTDWPGGSGAGNMANEVICGTIYARVAADNVATNSSLYVRMKTTAGADGDGWLTGDGVTLIISMIGTPAVTEATTGSTSSWTSSSVAAVRQTSTTDDANWYEINWAWKNTADFSTLYTQVAVAGGAGSGSDPASIEFWGPRIHGAGGTGVSTAYTNQNAHRGTTLWGPLYNPDASSTTTPSTWSEGATLQLDRDVVLEAGNEYEVYLRSTYSPDTVTGSDVTTRVYVAQSEVPASASVTKSARTGLQTTAPEGMVPTTGDVYAFGKLNNSVEDCIITDITLDPGTLEREITGIEYVEAVYDDTAFGTMGDLTVSDLMPPGVGGNSSLYGFGGDGPQGSAFSISAIPSPYRTANAEARPAITITLRPARGTMPYKECRLWISQLSSSGRASEPRHIVTLPYAVQSYRYDDSSLDPVFKYRIHAQRVGWRGTSTSVTDSPWVEVRPVITPRIPTAPSLEVEVDGFEQIYRTSPAQDGKVATIDARVGGWIISTPGFVVNPEDRSFTSSGIAVGALNAKGETNFPVYARASLQNGSFGVAQKITTTASFSDARATHTKIAEDDFATVLTVPSDLQVASGILQWDEAGPSTSIGPVYAEMDEFDLGSATRAIPTAMIEGHQVRPETLADLKFSLGSEDGKRWSIEGPMDDIKALQDNAEVRIEWKWSSTGTISMGYVPFESKEVYFRKCQMRLVWTRPRVTYQVRLTRFTAKLYLPPLFTPGDIDGGTF